MYKGQQVKGKVFQLPQRLVTLIYGSWLFNCMTSRQFTQFRNALTLAESAHNTFKKKNQSAFPLLDDIFRMHPVSTSVSTEVDLCCT